jgi:beta-glucanase (GH16 family)
MKKRLLAAMAVAASGLICAATGPASARPVALSTAMIHPDTGGAGGPNVSVPRPVAPQPGTSQSGASQSGASQSAASQPAVAATASPSPSATYSGPPAPDPSGTPTFASDFSGRSLNTSIWATCYPWMDVPTGCTNFGNANEQEWYLPSQDQVSGGVLHLVAQPIATRGTNSAGAPKTYECRSGMVTTMPGFSFEYGVVQVVARIPSTAGLWPALWLLATDEVWPPEIDMLEEWGPPDRAIGEYFHPTDYMTVGVSPLTGDLSTGWHTFTLQWTPTSLTWWIDGQQELTTSSDIPAQEMYFLADLADYSMSSKGSCQGSLLIQSVKIWQAGVTPTPTPTATATATATRTSTATSNVAPAVQPASAFTTAPTTTPPSTPASTPASTPGQNN